MFPNLDSPMNLDSFFDPNSGPNLDLCAMPGHGNVFNGRALSSHRKASGDRKPSGNLKHSGCFLVLFLMGFEYRMGRLFLVEFEWLHN